LCDKNLAELRLEHFGSKTYLNAAFDQIEVGTGKAWEPLRAYIKRLENIAGKDSSASSFRKCQIPGQTIDRLLPRQNRRLKNKRL
jgi:hypothetical protein